MRKRSRYRTTVSMRKKISRIPARHYATMSIVLSILVAGYVFAPIGGHPLEKKILFVVPLLLVALALYFYSEHKRGYRLID